MSTFNADDQQHDRLTNVESLLMHVERQVAELNKIVLEQGRQIERVERELRRQRESAGSKYNVDEDDEESEWP